MKTFLENLENALKKQNLSDQEIKEIIEDHDQMIKEAMDDGLKVEDLRTKFGDPESLAQALAEDKSPQEESDIGENPSHTYKNDQVQGLIIRLLDEDLSVNVSEGSDYKVQTVGGDKNKYKIYLSNKQLFIERKTETAIKLKIFRPSESCDFKITVPKDHDLKNIKIQSKSSDILIKDIKSKHLKIDSMSGDMDLDKISINAFQLKTLSGDVQIKQSSLDTLDISLVSGDVQMTDLKVKGNINLNTVSGDILFKNSSCQLLGYNAVSGDLTGKEFYPESMSVRTVSGDIKFNNSQEDKKIKIISSTSLSGDIRI